MCLISDRTLAALKEIYRSYDEILSNEQMVNGHLSFWVFEGLSSPFNKGASIIYVEKQGGGGSLKCQLYYIRLMRTTVEEFFETLLTNKTLLTE